MCDWHTFNSCEPNPNVLYGALVAGPDQNDNFIDERDNFEQNDVSVDYNAGFQSLVAAVKCKAMGTKARFRNERSFSQTSTVFVVS